MDCAVLFADVAGSTALYEVLGDERAFALVGSCLQAMSACTAESHGRVIKTIGDAVMAVFRTADEAAAAAVAMHERVLAMGPQSGVRLALRIGFHFGPVVAHDHDVFGDTVNLASRLSDQAARGQIVLDRATAALLSPRFAPALSPLFSMPVKGKAEEIELVELAWQAPSEDKTLIVAPRAKPGVTQPPAMLHLRLGEREIEMGPERRKLTIGREADSDVSIPERCVSRAHAMIERRRDHFVLADHSSNGSYVSFEGRPELKLQHEELTLVGHGFIAFGQPRAEAALVLEFGAPG